MGDGVAALLRSITVCDVGGTYDGEGGLARSTPRSTTTTWSCNPVCSWDSRRTSTCHKLVRWGSRSASRSLPFSLAIATGNRETRGGIQPVLVVYLASKAFEWLDTVLLIVNREKIIPLHLWHHATIGVAFTCGVLYGRSDLDRGAKQYCTLHMWSWTCITRIFLG